MFSLISYRKNAKTVLPKTILKINNTKKNTIVLSWNKVIGANGYTVYRSTSLNGKYTAIKNTTKLTYSNSGLTSGKKYYYIVKAYRLVNGEKKYTPYNSNKVNKVVK